MFSKRNYFISFLNIVFLLSIYLTNNSAKTIGNEDIVAKIGNDYEYTFKDLKKYVFDWSYDKRYRNNLKEGYSLALDTMVTSQLKRIDFFARGLNKDQSLIKDIKRIINESVVIEYYTTQYFNKYLTDEFVKKIYSIADKQVKYQRILLRVPRPVTKAKIDSVQKQALDIREEILKGKDFGTFVKKYSQDSLSLNTNGFVQPVGWEQSLSDPMGEVIFNLKTGDVYALNTNDGFYVIKVIDVVKLDLKPLEQIKDELLSKIKLIYSNKSLTEFKNDRDKLVDTNSFKWNYNTLKKLAAWSEIKDFYNNLYQDTLKNAITKNNMTILTYSGGTVDLKEYLYLLDNVFIPKFTEVVKVEDLQDFILESIKTDKVIKNAEKFNIEEKIFNVKTNDPILQTRIVYLYNKAVIDPKVENPTEKMLHKFYNEQKDTLYHLLHKVNIYAMVYPDKKQAEDVMQKIKDGTPFEKISGSWLVKTFVRDRDGIIKSYLSSEKPLLGEAAMKLNLNETAGPVKYYDPEKGEQYAIIKCVRIRPETQLQFDDVAKTIEGDYRNYRREIIKKEVREELWKKYKAEKFLDVVVKKLSSETTNNSKNILEN